jgi:hypothetical protein
LAALEKATQSPLKAKDSSAARGRRHKKSSASAVAKIAGNLFVIRDLFVCLFCND